MTSKVIQATISKYNGIPLYEQLKEILKREIEEGLLKPYHQIPSERILCEKYGVSRITVRQALSELMTDGLIQRKQGKGTFVAPKKVDQGLTRIVNFAKTVIDIGLKPSSKIIEHKVLPADIVLSRILNIPVTSQIFKLTILGLGDDEPLVVYVSYFPLWLGKKMFEAAKKRAESAVAFSTYDLYGEDLGLTPKQVDQTFEAITADRWVSSLLKVKKGSAIFMVTSLFSSSDQKPLEFRKAMYRGNRYKFHITRTFS